MKTLICFLMVIVTTQAFANWEKQEFPGKNFNDIFFANQNTGIAVGNSGIIFRTINGGKSWDQMSSLVNNNLGWGELTENGEGIIGGTNILLKTSDFGLNWYILRQWFSTDQDSVINAETGKVGDHLYVMLNRGLRLFFMSSQFCEIRKETLVPLFSRSYHLHQIVLINDVDPPGYLVAGAEPTPVFAPTYRMDRFDHGWKHLGTINFYQINYGYWLLSDNLLFQGWQISGGNVGYGFQGFNNPLTGYQISEWWYLSVAYGQPNWYIERGKRNVIRSMALDETSQNIYSVGLNEADRDNIKPSCIKRFNVAEDKIYREYWGSENFSSVCTIKGKIFACGYGFIIRKIEDGLGVIKTPIKNSLYPNPFNPVTTISYELPFSVNVQITVYDLCGRQVAILMNEMKPAGSYKVSFDGTNLSSGTYFYRLIADDFVETKKMILIK